MTAAVILRHSWLKLFAARIAMACLLVAWKFYDSEGAGNVFVFVVWLTAIVWFVAMFTPATKQSQVATSAQLAACNVYRVAMIGSLVWLGHPGLAMLLVVGAFAAAVEILKYDANGMPLPKKAGAA